MRWRSSKGQPSPGAWRASTGPCVGTDPSPKPTGRRCWTKKNSSIVVSDGTYNISATMSNHNKAVLKVLVEETRGPPPKYTANCFPHPKDISKDRHPQAFPYLPK